MKRLVLIMMGVLLMAACGPNRDKELKAIEEHEAQLSALDVNTQDEELTTLMNLYTQFANHFPTDSLAPVYLLRAADLSISLSMADRAVCILDTIISQYPGFEDIGGCYFLKGYAFETAEQFDSARTAYTYFVENYPDHPLAADTRRSLDYLGMTPEEMLEAILANAE